jgi:hypothetical protein
MTEKKYGFNFKDAETAIKASMGLGPKLDRPKYDKLVKDNVLVKVEGTNLLILSPEALKHAKGSETPSAKALVDAASASLKSAKQKAKTAKGEEKNGADQTVDETLLIAALKARAGLVPKIPAEDYAKVKHLIDPKTGVIPPEVYAAGSKELKAAAKESRNAAAEKAKESVEKTGAKDKTK